MCPGGWIVPAATEPDGVVVNGMSLSRRDSPFANSGLVVAVELADLPGDDPLRGVALQRRLEQAAARAGGGALARRRRARPTSCAARRRRRCRRRAISPASTRPTSPRCSMRPGCRSRSACATALVAVRSPDARLSHRRGRADRRRVAHVVARARAARSRHSNRPSSPGCIRAPKARATRAASCRRRSTGCASRARSRSATGRATVGLNKYGECALDACCF